MSIVSVAIFAGLLLTGTYLVVFFKLSSGWKKVNVLVLALWILGAIFNADEDFFIFMLGVTLLLMPLSILRLVLNSAIDARSSRPKASTPTLLPVDEKLRKATLLRLKLKDLHQAGELNDVRYQILQGQVDAWVRDVCRQWHLPEAQHQRLLEAAWRAMQTHLGETLGDAPWSPPIEEQAFALDDAPAATPPTPSVKTAPAHPPLAKKNSPLLTPSSPVLAQKTMDTGVQQRVNPPVKPAHTIEKPPQKPRPSRPAQPTISTASHLKNRLNSFLSEVLWRFLWQNIGWFIAGFCLVSGSVFLVIYSSGYDKALAVLGVLSSYAALLFFGGYWLRRKRQDVETVSQVLLTIGVLLVPLVFATSTRLILHDQGVLLLSVLLAGVMLLSAIFAVRLVSGVMDRLLLKGHPSAFIALAAMQFFAPVLVWVDHWYALAGLHLALLLMLGIALHRFTHQWLRQLFLEQRKLSYYAAGTLIYAAIVSFISLTWSHDITLPAGYSGPFLMALGLMLFNVDRHLKQWVEKKAWLDHFSFVIYAVSIVAVLLAWWPMSAALPAVFAQPSLHAVFMHPSLLPLSLTLALGAVLYGLMLWHYLTLPPLYLLIAAFAGEYALLLWPFPADMHFLLSVPGFAALLLLRRFLLQRKAERVALMINPVLLGLIPALVVWSLWQAQPGWAAMLTPLTAALLMLPVLDIHFAQLLDHYRQAKPAGKRCYLLSVFVTLTLAYAPVFFASWVLQFSLALLLLGIVWGILTRWALYSPSSRCQAQVFMDSALLSVLASTGLAWYGLPMPLSAEWLIPASGIMLLLSLWLNSRVLLYLAALGCATAAMLLIDHFDITTTGNTTLGLGILSFIALRWAQYRIELKQRVTAEVLGDVALVRSKSWRLRPLHLWTIRDDDYNSRAEMLTLPLKHALWLLWLLGMFKLARHTLFGFDLPLDSELAVYDFWGHAYPAFLGWTYLLGAVLTVLLMTEAPRWLRFLQPLALVLFNIAVLLLSAPFLAMEFYSLLIVALNLWVWWTAIGFIPHLTPLWQALGGQAHDDAAAQYSATERYVHHTAFVLIAGALFLPLSTGGVVLLLSLWGAIVFWAHAGQRYQYPLHAYLVVGGLSLELIALYSTFADVRLWQYLNDLELGWLLTGLSLGLASLGWLFCSLDKARFSTDSAENATALSSTVVRGLNVYQLPLYHLAYVLYGFAIIIILPLQPWINILGHHPASLSLLLLAQTLVLWPLLRSPEHPWLISNHWAAHLRGVFMPILLTLALINLLVVWQVSEQIGVYSLVAWGFVCGLVGWAIHCSATPSTRAPFATVACQWLSLQPSNHPMGLRIAPYFAPWWGLFLVAGIFSLHLLYLLTLNGDSHAAHALVRQLPDLLSIGVAPIIYALFALQAVELWMQLSLTLYLLLLVSLYPGLRLLRWISAVAVLLTGWLVVLKLFPLEAALNPPLVIGVLIWLNLLLYQATHISLPKPLRVIYWPQNELRYLSTGWLILFLLVLAGPTLLLVTQATVFNTSIKAPSFMTLGLSLLLTLSFAHWYGQQRRLLTAHWLLLSLTISLLLLGMAVWPLWLCVCVGLWGALLWLWGMRQRDQQGSMLTEALEQWVPGLFALGLLNLLNPWLATYTQLLTLVLLGSFALAFGLFKHHRSWLLVGLGLLFMSLHWWWLLWLPEQAEISALLPWFSVQTVLLAWLYAELQHRLQGIWLRLVNSLPLLPILILLSLSEWWWYVWTLYQSLLYTGLPPAGLFGLLDALAVTASVLLLFALWLRHATQRSEAQIYLQAMNLGLLILFWRLLWVGLAAPSAWDTTVLLGIAALLVALSHLRPHPAIERLGLFIPVLALFTVPSTTSAHTSLTLFTAAALYWLMHRQDSRPSVSLYLGLLALNLGIYVWVPSLAEQNALVQIYTLPAALSVLLMLQLHWLELKPSVAHAVRLTALSAIYLSATLDVFLRPDFSLFLLALGLSLGGVLLGIALRIKAFLYAGTLFLIFNVVGQ